MALIRVTGRLTHADKAAAVPDELADSGGDLRVFPPDAAGVCGVGIADIDNDIQRIQQMRVVLDILKADKLHVKGRTGQHLNDTGIAIVLLVIEGVMHHVTAPSPHFTPTVQHGHSLDTVGCGALDVLVQFAELVADALHVVHELRELQGQFQIAAIADAVDGLAQDSAAGCNPVLLGFPHRVAALVEGVGEEVRQETALGVLHALNVRDQAQGGAVAHAAHYGIQSDGLELRHERFGADPVIAEEHHGFAPARVGDVHHLLGKLCHLAALEGLKIPEFLAGHPVLVVIVALIDDVLRAELVAHFLLKLVEDIRADRSRVSIPVHELLTLQLVEDQGELVEEGGVADDVYIGVLCNELAQALHGILVGLGLTHVKGDLVLKIRPAVGGSVVHMHRVPDEVSQKTDGILMERYGLYRHTAVGVAPLLRRHGLTGGSIHDLPPAGDVVVGVHLHQLRADALHQRDGHGVAGGGVKAGHDVALLYLVRVCLCPCVVLAGGIVGGVDLGVRILELLREVGAVAVADGISTPLF